MAYLDQITNFMLSPNNAYFQCDIAMTWWLRVRSPVEATFLSGVFSPLTSAEACEESSGFGKKSCVSTGVRKPGNTYASPTAMI